MGGNGNETLFAGSAATTRKGHAGDDSFVSDGSFERGWDAGGHTLTLANVVKPT